MSEFEELDFDAFLADSVEHDARLTDDEAYVLRIQTTVDDALTNEGYVSVRDPVEHARLSEMLMNTYRLSNPEATEDELSVWASEVIKRVEMSNQEAITMIQMLFVSNEYRIDNGKSSDATNEKRRLYADLIVRGKRSPEDPILRVLNTLVAGEEVDPDSEYMVPFIAEALQEQEATERQSLERDGEIRSIMSDVGMSEDDPNWQAVKIDVMQMYMITMPYMNTQDGRANLSAKLYEMPVNAVSSQQRQQLIEFFVSYK